MCFGCSRELSHQNGSFEYPQHMFWLRNKKNHFQLHTLIWGPGVVMLWLISIMFTLFPRWIIAWLYPLYTANPLSGTLANREDTDEMPQNAAFPQSLHCLLR